jgi:hypothetical protein
MNLDDAVRADHVDASVISVFIVFQKRCHPVKVEPNPHHAQKPAVIRGKTVVDENGQVVLFRFIGIHIQVIFHFFFPEPVIPDIMVVIGMDLFEEALEMMIVPCDIRHKERGEKEEWICRLDARYEMILVIRKPESRIG